ncbi:MAG: glycoside hydrolase family protein [Cyanobium sp.]
MGLPLRRWHLLPLALMGFSGPAALGQPLGAMGVNTPGVNTDACRTMALPLVYVLTLIVAMGTFFGLYLVKRRLTKEGWSLANALSEPTRLTIPAELRWTDSGGDQLAMGSRSASSKVMQDTDGTPVALTLLEASSSRMIATLGSLAILMLYMGFGTFALYSFGLTCQLPASMPAVTTFLLSGLSLFAPYVANKISTAIQPGIRAASAGGSTGAAHIADQAGPSAPPSAPGPARLAASLPVLAPEPRPVAPSEPRPSTSEPRPTAASEPRPAPLPAPEPVVARPPAASPRPVSAPSTDYAPALQMIRDFEGFVDHAYPDPASGAEPWTIGYGFTTLNGRPVQPGQTITRAEADGELQRQAQACATHLAGTIPYWQQMNTNQRCALLDFAWNLGSDFYGDESNFSSITRDLKNHDWAQVPQSLLLYCDPGTSVEAGLLRRRQAEAQLWSTPVAAGKGSPPRAAAAPSSRFSNPLKVPYNDQLRMADGQGWRECFSASSAMLAMFWGKEPNENVYDQLRARYGDSTDAEAQLGALRSLGLEAHYQTDGTVALLKEEIDAGRPVAVGWLCDGPVSAPSGGGHWIVIIGYDATGFFVNDPYGNCDLMNGGYLSHDDGAGLHYSYQNWVPRWRVDGTGGWMLTCRA